MSRWKQFWGYWWDNIETAKKGREKFLLLVLICFTIVYVVGKIWGVHIPSVGEFTKGETFDLIEFSTVIAFVAIAIVWLPFKRHEEEKKTLAAKIAEKETDNQKLQAEIRQLKSEESDKTTQDAKITQLGLLHRKLAQRISIINNMDFWTFADENAGSMKNEALDPTSWEIIQEIQHFLGLEMKTPGAYIAIFTDKNDMESIPREPVPVGHIIWKRTYWLSTIIRLRHYAKQLMKVIEYEIEKQGRK